MANLYYSNADVGQRFVEGELARGSDVDAKFDDVEAGFDEFPTPTQVRSSTQTYVTAGGVANAYTITLTSPNTITAYSAGHKIAFKVPAANTGASTINVDGVGVVNLLRPDGTALQASDIFGGMIVEARCDGTNYRLLGATYAVSLTGTPITWLYFAVSGNCVAGLGHVIDNTQTGIVMTLPASPNDGDTVFFKMEGGTKTWGVDPGSKGINSASGVMTVNRFHGSFAMVFKASDDKWVL